VEGLVYGLCAATALACGVLLLRGYFRSRVTLLLWCALFFLALTVENAILFADRQLVPDLDLLPIRRAVGLGGAMVLLYGLIWEVDRRPR
jgi:hypothetical protein